jgi:hypothetical protein
MIELIIALLVGIWIGRTVSNVINQWTFSKILEDLKVTDRQLMELRDQIDGEEVAIVEIKLEQHLGQLYAYRKDTEEFLGQGTDREQLIETLKTRFTGKTTVVVREQDGAELIKS